MSGNKSGESGRKAETGRIIKKIQREHARAGTPIENGGHDRSYNWNDGAHRSYVRNAFEEFNEPILPGFGPDGLGENARDDCGESHPFVCDSCGHVVEFGRTCGQSVCARCAVAWCRDLAVSKSAKIRRVRKEMDWNTPDDEHQKIHHLIISPPLHWFRALADAGLSLEEAMKITKKIVKTILDEMRAQGLVAQHSFRGENEDGSPADENDDRGKWKERLNSDRDWFGDVRDQLAWMPHFHCIVVSDFLKGDGFTDQIEEKTGWVIHRIANDDGVSIPNDGTMAKIVTYALSHADIDVRDDAQNRSAVWEVGSFQGDPIKSSSRFTPSQTDKEWAGSVVRRHAPEVLGLRSGTTDCGTDLPAVDDPDEMARQILNQLFPDDDLQRVVATDEVLAHVSAGNISVSTSTTSGGGGSVTVTDAFGGPVDEWVQGPAGSLPDAPDDTSEPDVVRSIQNDDDADDCDCDDHDEDTTCEGTLIPLGVARHRGLLEDDEWCRAAPFVDEAQEADLEWPDDLDPWRSSGAASLIGVG